MPERISILGKRFGRLYVTDERDIAGALLGTPEDRRVEAACDCGAMGTFSARSLRRGRTTSCGCVQREAATTHGLSSHRLYPIWRGMLQRCHDPKASMFYAYGARGIYVCDEWRTEPTAFIAWATGRWAPGLEIDRRDNDGPYSPGNCRFVTGEVNARNTSKNRIVEGGERRVALAQAAQDAGIPYHVFYQRVVRLGWTTERAAKEPVRRLQRR